MRNPRGFDASARRQRLRMHQHLVGVDLRPVGCYLFREWRRGRAGIGKVLISVPRTRDAAVDDTPFPERPVLVLADIGDRGDTVAVLEDGDTLPADRDHTRP